MKRLELRKGFDVLSNGKSGIKSSVHESKAYKDAPALDECIKQNQLSDMVLFKKLNMNEDQFCTALAYGYLIVVELKDIELNGELNEGFVVLLIVGYNMLKKEFIIQTPYAWLDRIDNDVIYIDFKSIIQKCENNCIIYTKGDINKVLY